MADLGVPLDEVDDAALLVEPPVLVLAEAVEVLALDRLEAHLDLERTSRQIGVAARRHGQAVDGLLAQQLRAGGDVPERQRSRRGRAHLDLAVPKRGSVSGDGDARLARVAVRGVSRAPTVSSRMLPVRLARTRSESRPQGSMRTTRLRSGRAAYRRSRQLRTCLTWRFLRTTGGARGACRASWLAAIDGSAPAAGWDKRRR